jgi:integrase/recombinase XerD
MNEILTQTSKDLELSRSNLNKIESDNKSAEIIALESHLIQNWLFSKPESTRISYQTDVKQFFDFYQDLGLGLKAITETHISLFLKENKSLKASSLSRKKSAISSLLKHLVKKGYLDKNPCDLLDPIKVPDQTQFRVLSHEEILKMIELEDSERNKTILRTLYKTGLRVGELVSLRFSSLKNRDGKYFLIVVGKGSKTRTIGIDQKSYDNLKSLKDETSKSNEDFIFRSKILNSGLSTKSIWKIIKAMAIRAGLDPKVSPHWTRHSHATKALELGEDLRVIQHTLGHDSIMTTTKYTNVYPGKSSGEKIDV